jgi:hypothetical protein
MSMSMSDIQAFMSGEWISVTSSNVAAGMYSPDTETLHLRFHNGGEYQYLGISPADAEEFAVADSAGGFVWNRLRIRGTKNGARVPYIGGK